MASTREHFSKFFECWLAEQDRDLQALREAAAEPAPGSEAAAEIEELRLRQLIMRVMEHYEYYYKAKGQSAKRDVVAMFSPKWTSSTENLFIWVGGWRPSSAVHILYSKSGIQFELKMNEVISGMETRDLAGLSPEQLKMVDELQRKVIKKEREITEEEAKVQEKVANRKMVETVDVMTEKVEREVEMVEEMEEEMKRRRGDMERVLEKADGLRMETIKEIVEMLKPMQAVHFLIAAVELLLRVHEFGVAKDAAGAGV
ncbi:Transcription factor TGA like domain-containing protein [Dioscorea alata]|uniref:Transcription factor TGA like domain-containing protein n=1 Tax=Dioscorea alata TaxID=55571 RepID=A0ACB7VU31_DIOAL|nr:Transcription factor TGA like domain-containing protein [Dioscorea alata]